MIVVTTPTGHIGSQLVARLLDAGQAIRVIVRDPAKLSADVRGKAEVVQGSIDDPAVLSTALKSAEALFWVVPPSFTAENIDDYYLHFTRTAAQAVTAQSVKRVVAVSSLGRNLKRKAGLINSTHAADELIEKTGVDFRALWNPSFMENMLRQIPGIKATGAFVLPGKPDVKIPLAATRDIAETAAKLLLDASWTGQGGVAVLGPEDLSYNDMATIMSDVVNMPIHFEQATTAAYKASVLSRGASESVAQGYVDMFAAISEGLYNAEPRTAANTTSTSFRQWCEEVFKPAFSA